MAWQSEATEPQNFSAAGSASWAWPSHVQIRTRNSSTSTVQVHMHSLVNNTLWQAMLVELAILYVFCMNGLRSNKWYTQISDTQEAKTNRKRF